MSENKIQIKLSLTFVVLCLALQGCAMATTYGKKPEQISPDRYQFKVFFNIAANDGTITSKANEIMQQIKTENGYASCALLRNDTRSQTGVNARASEIFDVVCKK